MSRWWDDLAAVVELACLNETRTNAEQQSLLRVAFKIDQERAKQTVTNPPEHRKPPHLEQLADCSRQLEAGDRRITTPSEKKNRTRRANADAA